MCVAVAAIALGSLAGGAPPKEATPHVRARGDVDPALVEEFARLAEAAYPQWKAYFGAEPRKEWLPLDLVVLKDRASFLSAVHAAGASGDFPGAGGYYHPATRTSYLYLQPHLSSSRLLVLHELTHQYQYKAVQDNGDRTPVWHKEGLAEHFGFHRRTAAGLETGALDVVAIDSRPVQCAARVREGKVDLWAIGTGAAQADYTDALAMVETFLRTSDAGLRTAFHEWEKDVYRGAPAASRFEKAFRGKKDRLEAALKEVWGRFERTWSIVYIAWDEDGGDVVGRGLPWAFLKGSRPLSGATASVEAAVALSPGAVAGGVAIGVRGPDDLVSAEVCDPDGGGRLRLRVKRAGVWTEIGTGDVPGGALHRRVGLRLAVEGTDLVVTVDGNPVLRVSWSSVGLTPADLGGTAGLIAESGEVRFGSVRTGGS